MEILTLGRFIYFLSNSTQTKRKFYTYVCTWISLSASWSNGVFSFSKQLCWYNRQNALCMEFIQITSHLRVFSISQWNFNTYPFTAFPNLLHINSLIPFRRLNRTRTANHFAGIGVTNTQYRKYGSYHFRLISDVSKWFINIIYPLKIWR